MTTVAWDINDDMLFGATATACASQATLQRIQEEILRHRPGLPTCC